MKPDTNTVALRIAAMMTRSKKTRATLLDKELQMLAETSKSLPAKSFVSLKNALDDYGYSIAEANNETYVLVKISALEGAAPIVPSKKMIQDLLAKSDSELLDELNLPEYESYEE